MNQIFSFIFNHRVLLFYVSILLLLILNRKKFEVQAKIIFLYRTKIGLKFMDYIANKFNKTIKFLGVIGIWAGYIGFVFITYSLIKLLISLLRKPETIGVSPVIPGVALAGTGIVFPLIIGWISIIIIILVHEFSHGVVARAYKLKILSSGLAFFGPILGAFVEPDEKQISKQSSKIQNSIYAAGPFANMLLTLVAVLLLFFVTTPLAEKVSTPIGMIIGPLHNTSAAYNASLHDETLLYKINDVDVTNQELFSNFTSKLKPGDSL
jgi:hypothetical protein